MSILEVRTRHTKIATKHLKDFFQKENPFVSLFNSLYTRGDELKQYMFPIQWKKNKVTTKLNEVDPERFKLSIYRYDCNNKPIYTKNIRDIPEYSIRYVLNAAPDKVIEESINLGDSRFDFLTNSPQTEVLQCLPILTVVLNALPKYKKNNRSGFQHYLGYNVHFLKYAFSKKSFNMHKDCGFYGKYYVQEPKLYHIVPTYQTVPQPLTTELFSVDTFMPLSLSLMYIEEEFKSIKEYIQTEFA